VATKRCPEGHIYSERRYGNVCPYCSKTVLPSKRTSSSDDTINDAVYAADLEIMDPVTGWLVCIEGPSKGRDYKIRSQKNFLGRADGMDIQVLGDNSIAKKNHAAIVYNPKKRVTLLLPGDSHGLVYYNSEAIFSPVELAPFDTMEIGSSKFLFVELCGNHFEWSELDETADNKQEA